MEALTFRPFQQEFIDTAIRKFQEGKRVLIADVHPGSGKTLACLAAADKLIGMNAIDLIVVLVPRINLAQQFEEDWHNFRKILPWEPSMKELYHSDNRPPLIIGNSHGYITTYDSVVSNPVLHHKTLRNRRFLLICDEAQQLGTDYDGSSTRSAYVVDELAQEASFIFVVSGTPYRADGSKLLFAEYGETDAFGKQRLLSDVNASYLQGVRDGYLRPFQAVLHDGNAIINEFGSGTKQTKLSDMTRLIGETIQQPDYWQPMTDKFIERLMEVKRDVDSRLCGLISAGSQKHAKQIEKYINKYHPQMRTLIAVSEDGDKAHKSLKKFRDGGWDILVTVQMAYVGYDHKPIMAILVLTAYRTEGYLRQLMARGLRMWAAIDSDYQALHAFVPDDPYMRNFVNKLRQESDAGARQKAERTGVDREQGEAQEKLTYIVNAFMTEMRAQGMDVTGDLTHDEYVRAEQIRKKLGIPIPVTKMMEFVRIWQMDVPVDAPGESKDIYIPYAEQMEKARSVLQKACTSLDSYLSVPFGTTAKRLWSYTEESVEECTKIEEINERLNIVKRWREQGGYPNV